MMSPSLRSQLQAPRTPCTLLPEAHPTQTQDQLKACLAQHLSALQSLPGVEARAQPRWRSWSAPWVVRREERPLEAPEVGGSLPPCSVMVQGS